MIKINLDKKKKYLLACSFGPDSMALFHLLRVNGYNFDCAIVNYHLRNESNFEVDQLVKYAGQYNIIVHIYDVPEYIGKNIEARCREIRYRFFKDLTDKYHYDATLVAHHQDDLIETYLMQKQRQNYPIFYGIKVKTIIKDVKIIRPLLNYRKDELLNIVKANNVPFVIDVTNYNLSIPRNKIRHTYIYKLIDEERSQILKEIREENQKLSQLLSSIKTESLNDVNYILSLDEATAAYALNILVKKLDDSLYLSKQNVGQVIMVLKSSKPNGQFVIKSGVILLKEYGYFDFISEKIKSTYYCYKLDKPDVLDTTYFYLNFRNGSSNRNVNNDDYPIIIRTIKLTDRITINGYETAARRLLIDWKVPLRKRLIWPVILNKNNKVIYIPRYQKDFVPEDKCNFYVK